MKWMIGQQNKTQISEAHGSSVWAGIDFAALLKAAVLLNKSKYPQRNHKKEDTL